MQLSFLRSRAVVVRFDGDCVVFVGAVVVMMGYMIRVVPGQQAGCISSNVFEKWCILRSGSYKRSNVVVSLLLLLFFFFLFLLLLLFLSLYVPIAS